MLHVLLISNYKIFFLFIFNKLMKKGIFLLAACVVCTQFLYLCIFFSLPIIRINVIAPSINMYISVTV